MNAQDARLEHCTSSCPPWVGVGWDKGWWSMSVPVSTVISEFFTNGYVLRHQLCKSTPFKKKMIESSPILEVREKNFRDSTYSSVTYLGLLLLVSSQDYRADSQSYPPGKDCDRYAGSNHRPGTITACVVSTMHHKEIPCNPSIYKDWKSSLKTVGFEPDATSGPYSQPLLIKNIQWLKH